MLQQYFNEQILFIVFVVFASATALQLIYFWFFYSRLAFGHDKNVSVQKLPVSVVICARNMKTSWPICPVSSNRIILNLR
jgi:hypothetical protein